MRQTFSELQIVQNVRFQISGFPKFKVPNVQKSSFSKFNFLDRTSFQGEPPSRRPSFSGPTVISILPQVAWLSNPVSIHIPFRNRGPMNQSVRTFTSDAQYPFSSCVLREVSDAPQEISSVNTVSRNFIYTQYLYNGYSNNPEP